MFAYYYKPQDEDDRCVDSIEEIVRLPTLILSASACQMDVAILIISLARASVRATLGNFSGPPVFGH